MNEAHRAALLCPYRHHASDVSVDVSDDNRSIKINFHVATQSIARRAEWFMRRTLEETLS
jgi:hypothetical protein